MVRGAPRDLKKESFWREMVRGQSGSGMSVRAWCRRHALSEPAFYWWRRRLAGRNPENPAAAFVPVRVTDDGIVGSAAATNGVAAGAGRIEVVLTNGRRVHLIGPVDRQALADVLAVLTAEVRDGEARAWAGEAGGEARAWTGGRGRAAERHGNGRITEARPC